MRPTTSLSLSLLSTLLLLPISTLAAFTGQAEADGVKFDFTQLKQHSVIVEHKQDPTVVKSTYTINPVGKIEVSNEVSKEDQCPDGTQVCMISRLWHGDKPDDHVAQIIPFGSFESEKGSEPEYTIMRDADKKVLGLNVTIHGPEYGEKKLKQSAIVKFLCDPEKTGLEPDTDGKDSNSLKFVSYEGDQTLTLEWRTKYACEKVPGETPAPSQGSWGFFTWFIVIAFLAVAAYLIFGSWLNYNKYGARGWDLLPHSDTLRDLPYLIKDFLRRAVNTFQGSGGRGGYSAI
ncbi:hypothetical protein TWF730_010532 [Orbilia blumenaviensis]|uniref:Autophagy-related protein 27 n=1 Tax=Orbilia blumenaviensis TaxID=1796055 RepID=A0AAV9UNY3_9PEZI